MRFVCASVAVSLLTFGSLRAEEPIVPKGAIGIQIKLDEGKMKVVAVLKDSPAEKAGLKEDDVLVKVGDTKIKENAEQSDLHDVVKNIVGNEPGTKVKVTVKRGDKEQTIEVTVGKPGIFQPKG